MALETIELVLDSIDATATILGGLLDQSAGDGLSYSYPRQVDQIVFDCFPMIISRPEIRDTVRANKLAADVGWLVYNIDVRVLLSDGMPENATQLAPLETAAWSWVENVNKILMANMTLNGSVDITGNTETGDRPFTVMRIGGSGWDTSRTFFGVYFTLAARARRQWPMNA